MNTERAGSKRLACGAGVMALCAGAAAAMGQQAHLYSLPDLPHSMTIEGGMAVNAVTDNGYVIANGSDMNSRWYGDIHEDTSIQGLRFGVVSQESIGLGKLAGQENFSSAYAASADGQQVFGESGTALNALGLFNGRAFKWTAATGMVQLGIIAGDSSLADFASIKCVTPDGSQAFGGCGSTSTYRWSQWPGAQSPFQYPDAAHTVLGEIEGVSDDQGIVWGTAYQLNQAIYWIASQQTFLSVQLPGASYSKAVALSGDGLTFVGNSDTVYQGQHLEHAFRFRQDTLSLIDLSLGLRPDLYHQVFAVSRDGSMVVGDYSFYPDGAPAWQGYPVAWIWRASSGITLLETYLTSELGLNLKGLLHPYATAISPNGRWIAGAATDPTDQDSSIAWLVDTGNVPPCYANCDGSTASPVLNVADFTCFFQKFATGNSYANCDNSTAPPVLNVADFTCFLQKFAVGCP
jgi:uncharacterized membrane protein